MFFLKPFQKLFVQQRSHIDVDAFPERYQHACFKRRFFLKSRQTDEVLQVRILRDLFHKLAIRKAEFLLDDQGAERHTERFRNIAGCTPKQLSVFLLVFIPGDDFGQAYPAIVWVHMKPQRLIEIQEGELRTIFCFVHDNTPLRMKTEVRTAKKSDSIA